MSHLTQIRVRGYHLDLYGHVNNARYLEFLEEARWAWFESGGDVNRFQDRGWGFAAVNINISYRRPALLGEVLEIRTSLGRFGRKSSVIRQDVVLADSGQRVADADVTFCIIDLASGRALALDDELRAALGAQTEADDGGV